MASDLPRRAREEVQTASYSTFKIGYPVGGRGRGQRLAKLESFTGNLESVNVLHNNVASGKLYHIHRMLETGKLDVNTINDEGDTALTVAINYGQKEAFRLLLKHGADPNIRSPPKERSFGICENSNLWKTIKDLEWCQLMIEAGYTTEKDEKKGGWIETLRRHLKDMEKRKDDEGVDLLEDPFYLTYTKFFQWYDNLNRREAPSLVQSCRHSIRNHLLQNHSGRSIYAAIEIGLKLPRVLHNYLLLQDGLERENWLDNYKNVSSTHAGALKTGSYELFLQDFQMFMAHWGSLGA